MSNFLWNRTVKEDLTLREKMFQEMKQEKENEIIHIKQMKRDLELKLRTLLEDDSRKNH